MKIVFTLKPVELRQKAILLIAVDNLRFLKQKNCFFEDDTKCSFYKKCKPTQKFQNSLITK